MVQSDHAFTLPERSRDLPGTLLSYCREDPVQKILLALSYTLITLNLLALILQQSQGFVMDIFTELPFWFFLSLLFCYVAGTTVLFLSQGSIRRLSILLLFFTYFTVLVIPYMLGYYSMGRSDDMSYIGEYLQISTSGHVAGWDIYPASHMIGAALSIVSGLAPHLVSFIIPVVFSFIFSAGLILCCRFFLKNPVFETIAIPVSVIFYLGPYNFENVPHALFFGLMPLFIVIICRFIKDQNFANLVLVLPFTLLVPYMHPFIIFFVMALFFTILVFQGILKRWIDANYSLVFRMLVIVFIGFIPWFIYNQLLLNTLKASYINYLEKVTQPTFFATASKLSSINITTFSFVKLVMVYYGRYTIPFIIIAVAVLMVYLKREQLPLVLQNRLYFGVFFYVIFFGLEAVLFFNPLIVHQPDRETNLNFIVYAQVPLFVLSLYILFLHKKPSCRKITALIVIISVVWGLSFFGTFDAPIDYKPSAALTYNEVQAMEWFYKARTTENVLTPVSQIYRFHVLLNDGGDDQSPAIPDHFGYLNDTRTFAQINLDLGEQNYMVLMTIDEFLYQDVPGYTDVGRYNAGDFSRFRDDPSVQKILDDKNIQIFDYDLR
jgi:hypothetical protein